MTPLQQSYKNQATTIIHALKKRNISGYYFETIQEATNFANNMIENHSTVSWGGSTTLKEIGLLDVLNNRPLTLLDRSLAKNSDEINKIYRDAFSADYYLMSTNAITLDGKLINIDGNGNRVAALIFGPKKVIIIAGMNKVAVDEISGIARVQNYATPPNAVRLNMNTPCAKTGKCSDCLSEDCLCCEIVITRKSRHNDRIHVILVGETLGF